MDGSRFDGWTRALATGASRRRALQAVAGGTLAGLLAHLGLEEASAACVKLGKQGCKGPQNKKCCQGATCKGGSKTKTGKCVCKGGLTKCGSKCINTQTNKQHCGACNKPCEAGQTCQGGTCVGGGGECTPACAGGQTCQGGTCACPAGTANSCDFAWPPGCYCCPVGQFHCGDGACHECCIEANCGGGGRYCYRGDHTCRCPNQQQDCNGICKTCCTTEHCVAQGSEDYICTTNENGDNICACPDGKEGCPKPDQTGYFCPDYQNDDHHCGQCHRNCRLIAGGWNCVEGICTPPPP